MRLTDTLPAFAIELENLLKVANRPELAAQVTSLRIVDRCRCNDDFCASFYTQPKPIGSYSPNQECLELDPTQGMLILDIVDGTIAHVELLNRGDVQKKLLNALP